MKNILGVLLVLIFFVQSCYYDKEEILYPDLSECNSSDADYLTVKNIISKNCLSCHNNSSASTLGDNIKLEDYDDVKYMAENGKLLGAVKHISSYSPMPKDGVKLNDCSISQIENWINSGTPNN